MTQPTDSPQQLQTANRAGVILSIVAGIVWVVYAMTGAHSVVLVVAIVLSILVGAYWAFGRDFIAKR
ncbi:hypothetical protein ATK17_1009 [Branchiibius hedensis]|uniref:Uncharacterized protein n=1 Tax=Branchiibius hedensis TaxID=672460 RepID=A0A2Y9C149_9MICO|nr:hypothetical protein [Branchiibius hedensis]PWJ24907.1 hypothetical protein ATK17_1009 [Branchiibius hedensis]SSA33723.1 hypothetical protein SAMN04489750_1009 [Branchiibius hedensis]